MSIFKQKNIKICLVGDGGVGKTTFVTKHRKDYFEQKYIPTMGVEVQPVRVNTNYGDFFLNLWDTAGQEKYGGLQEGYYCGAQAFIVFFDVTSTLSYNNTYKWIDKIISIEPDALIVLVGTKNDCKSRKVKLSQIFPYKNIQYYDISSKTKFNYENPFLYILNKLLQKDDINFVDSIPKVKTIDSRIDHLLYTSNTLEECKKK